MAARDEYLNLMEKRLDLNRERRASNRDWRDQMADENVYKTAANTGWLDRGIQGATIGSVGGPLAALVGGLAGVTTGIVEGGLAGEKAGYDDPWVRALSPISLDPKYGTSIGPEAQRGMAGLVRMGSGMADDAMGYLHGSGQKDSSAISPELRGATSKIDFGDAGGAPALNKPQPKTATDPDYFSGFNIKKTGKKALGG